MKVLVPQAAAKFLRAPILALSPGTCVETFELGERHGVFRQVDVADTGNLQSWLLPRQEVEFACAGAVGSMKRIHALAVHLPATGNEISTRFDSGGERSRALLSWTIWAVVEGRHCIRARRRAFSCPCKQLTTGSESGSTSAKETLSVTVFHRSANRSEAAVGLAGWATTPVSSVDRDNPEVHLSGAQITRIGLNENWRRDLKVIIRQ